MLAVQQSATPCLLLHACTVWAGLSLASTVCPLCSGKPPCSSPGKPVTISCGTQAALACTCDLGRQLEVRCRQVKQLRNAEAEQRDRVRSRDAAILQLKMQLQTVSNK